MRERMHKPEQPARLANRQMWPNHSSGMNRQYLPSKMSPLAAAFSALLGIGTVVLLFFFGLVVGAVLLVVGVAVALWLRVRLWLARRRGDLPRPGQSDAHTQQRRQVEVIEGQYSVVDDSADDRHPDR